MSARAGWYPDPGGGPGLYRYWDGTVWSAATTPNPYAPPPPSNSLGAPAANPSQQGTSEFQAQPGLAPMQPAQAGSGQPAPGYRQSVPTPGQQPYVDYLDTTPRKRSALGWWLAAGAVVVVLAVVAVFALRAVTGGTAIPLPGGGQPTQDVCPTPQEDLETPPPDSNDGRVHGGPVSYPRLGPPWGPPTGDSRVPFGRDVLSQLVTVEDNYQPGQNWVASVLVGELQAGDGFFTPEQGSQIVVKCILGAFYGLNEVESDVTVNEATTIDGHEGWLVESELSFDIEGLRTKGELLIVAIVSTGSTAGLFYASIPDTRPELVEPARQALASLRVHS